MRSRNLKKDLGLVVKSYTARRDNQGAILIKGKTMDKDVIVHHMENGDIIITPNLRAKQERSQNGMPGKPRNARPYR
jgi:hypothetical protein